MKKLWSLNSYKRRNSTNARRSLIRQIEFKQWKRQQNRLQLFLKPKQRAEKRKYDRFRGYVHLKAPENFTLIGNAEPVIKFIAKVKEIFDKKQKLFIILKGVKNIEYDAIVVLLSLMVRFKSQKIPFNGDFPADENVKETLIESGFFANLYRNFSDENRYKLERNNYNLIHTHAFKNVDSTLSAEVIEKASETVWGEKRRCQGAQRALIELMLNTNNHATVGIEGDKHWWLSVNHRTEANVVTFSFIDYGVGVFKSLENKPVENKFYKALDKMKQIFGFQSNAGLLELILQGEMHQTATGKHFRGKGLPGINDAWKRNSFSNLHIITNNVHANVSDGTFVTLNNNFSGTFVYWELNKNNISCDGNN